jgi:hypothetical protein
MSSGEVGFWTARRFAMVMLACWPIALVLIIGAVMYAKQFARFDQQQGNRP